MLKLFLIIFISVGLAPYTCFSKSKLNYPLIKAPKGEFTLQIPVYYSNKVVYIKKLVKCKKPFFIGKFEVTNTLWNQCFKDKGCNKPAFYTSEEGKNNPSVRLNWHDAYRFSKWISKKTGRKYRLPTEEEWAYAAYMGNDKGDKNSDKEVTYDYSSKSLEKIAQKITRPVGSMNRNEWGLNDYYGNVWEWTLTCWYGSEENMLKPRTTKELNDPGACTTRI
jgi:formylglycine-generating enzyme required for sulfatase activity